MASEITTQALSGFGDNLSGRPIAQPLQKAEHKATTELKSDQRPNDLQATRVDEKVADKLNPVERLQEKVQKDFSMDELQEVLDEINSAFYLQNRAIKFQVHDKTEDLVVQVLNTKTDEVIRQYPSEEILNRRKRLMEGDTNSFSTQVY